MTKPSAWTAALAAAMCAVACAPTLDWREFVPEGSEVSVRLPCRPDRLARPVAVAGSTLQMTMLACRAGDLTFALAFAEVADPTRIAAVLAEMRRNAVRNVQGVEPEDTPVQVTGMTPNDQAARLKVNGRLPDGAPVLEHAAFFTRGRRVYQATVIGSGPAPDVVETFFGGLKFPG
jgi:hypothetical protein